MNMDEKYILSIDIGGSKLMAGIIDYFNGNIILKELIPLKTTITEDYLVENILFMIERLINQCSNIDIACIGVSVPGTADSQNGVLIYACYSGIRNFEIGKILKEKFHIPVFVENDVNSCAYGEKIFGACKGIDDFLWITVSNGVGGALVLNGHIHYGRFKGAGEIGHINVAEDGYLCSCGNKGCLEAYASGPGIVRRYREKSQNYFAEKTAKIIAEDAHRGDELALEIYRETGYFLGKAISYAVNIVNPQKVILGGGVAIDIDLFLPEIKKIVDKMVFKDPNKNLSIEKTALSYEAALIGAAAIAKLRFERI
ncbi:MAG: ROK family protein [Candidatus Humimicrobiaceae bacterium]